MDQRRRLQIIYDGIDARARAIEDEHGPWPCRRGCDACCRSLGAPPDLTPAERSRVRRAYEALPPATRAEVRRRLEALAPDSEGRYVCPLLGEDAGACLIYADRPGFCRSYGFYVSRASNYWCSIIDQQLGERRDEIVWGNQAALDDALVRLSGPRVRLDHALLRDAPEDRADDESP